MSKTIDERVVSMQFDNKHFEQNVATTMSTLDKLKQKLNLKGASKGLEDVNASAKKVDLSSVSKAADTVGLRFSAMYTVADQAFRNITNAAMHAGKNIISALTIDPVKTGLSEYETKINAVQVIQSNTRSSFDTEEEQMETIYNALDRLNEYADRTIYNFAQMTDNVGKFVAQTGDVEKSVKAVEGLANLAGASGASAADMARATYQMSQALGGTIRKIDWNSLRNANMATLELKNMLMDMAKIKGIDLDSMIANKGTFEDTLEEGWLTGDLFLEAMNIYSDAYSEAELAAMGFNEEQIANFKELADNARKATTEVKTITQLWDVLKETAQSGWTQTWELIIGDFGTAKEMLTGIQEYFSGIINGWSDIRNTLLGGALNMKSPWAAITEKLENTGLGKIVEVAEKIEDVTDKLTDFQKVVGQVWQGDYGNADTGRFEKLEALGYDHRVVQDLVNKGRDYELTVDDVRESHEKFGITLKKNAETTKEVTAEFSRLSEEELRNAELTEGEIRLYNALADEAERTGKSINEIVEEMSKKDGRTMLIESFKNAWSGLVSIFTAVKEAWSEIFPPMTVVQLYNIIDAINDFSERLLVSEETVDKVTRTFKGVFAILDVILTVLKGPFAIAFDIAGKLLGTFGISILDVTAFVGDALVKFRDWIDSILDFGGAFEKIAEPITKMTSKIGDWIDKLKEAENVPQFIAKSLGDGLGAIVNAIKSWFGTLREHIRSGFKNIPSDIISEIIDSLPSGIKKFATAVSEFAKTFISSFTETIGVGLPFAFEGFGGDIVSGLISGISNGIKNISSIISTLAKKLIEVFTGILGIESPSKVFIALGGFIVAGLVLGLLDNIGFVVEAVKKIGSSIADIFSNVDLSGISAIFWTISSIFTNCPIFNAIAAFTNQFSMWGSTVSDGAKTATNNAATTVSTGFDNITNTISTFAKKIGDALKTVYNVVSDKVGALVSFLEDNFGAIASIVGGFMILSAVTKLAGIIERLSTVVSKVTDAISGMLTSFGKAAMLVGMGVFVFLLAYAITELAEAFVLLSDLSWPDIGKGAAVIGGLALVLSGLAIAIILISSKIKTLKGANMAGVAAVMIALAAGVMILAYSLQMMDKVDDTRIWQHLGAIGTMAVGLVVIAALMSKVKGEISKGSLAMIAIAAAILILVFALTKLNALVIDDPVKTIGALIALAAGLALVAFMSKGIDKGAALGMLGMVASIWLFTVILKKIAESGDIITDSLLTVIVILGLFVGLMAATRLIGKDAGKDMFKVCSGILMLSLALVVVVGAMKMIAKMDPSQLEKGLKAVAIILLVFAAIIAVSKLSGEHAMKAGVMLVMMSTALLILTGAIWLLSIIGRDNPEGLKEALNVVATIMSLFIVVIAVSKLAAKSTASIIAITVAIVALVAVVGILTLLAKDPETLRTAITTLAMIMTMLAVVIAALGFVKTTGTQALGVMGMLIVISGVMFLLTYLIKDLAKIEDIDKAMSAVKMMSMLIVAMSAACFLLGKAGSVNVSALTGVLALGAVLAELAIIFILLDHCGVVAPSLEMVTALSVLLIAMSEVTLILSKIKPAAAGYAIVGALALMAIIIIIGGLAMGIGWLVSLLESEDIERIKTGLQSFLDILGVFAAGLGEAIGKFYTGFVGGAIEGLGQSLTDFMTNIQGFIDGLKQVDSSILTGAANLTGAILALTAAAFIEGIATLFSFGSGSISSLGDQLSAFGTCMITFADSVSDLTPVDILNIQLAAIAGQAVADLANSIPKTGGWWQAIAGESDMESFGLRMEAFGHSLVRYAKSIRELKSTDRTNISKSAEVGTAMTALESSVPKQGGWWQDIAGSSDIEAFGLRMEAFGHSLVKYAKSISELKSTDITSITDSADVGTAMTALESSVPRQGGWWQAIAGESDIETFGSRMEAFGSSLIGYVKAVADLPTDSSTTISNSQSAAEALVKVADVIPKDDGWWGKIAGEQNFEAFGTGMYQIARGLRMYASVAKDIDSTDTDNINNSKSAIEAMVNVAEALPNEGGFGAFFTGDKDISSFGTGMSALATGVKDYIAAIEGIEWEEVNSQIEASKTAIGYMADAARDIPNDGGLWDLIAGKNGDLTTFGSQMCTLIDFVVDYAVLAAPFANTAIVDRIEASKKAIGYMADAARDIPNDGGLWDLIAGKNGDLTTFGSQMCTLIDYVVDYASLAAPFANSAWVDRIEASKTAIQYMADAARSIPNDGGLWDLIAGKNGDLTTFGSQMCTLVDDAVDYAIIAAPFANSAWADRIANSEVAISNLSTVANSASALANIDLTNASKTIDNLVDIVTDIKELPEIDSDGVGSLSQVLADLAESGIDGFVKAFDDRSDDIEQAGTDMMETLISGLREMKKSVLDAVGVTVQIAITKLRATRTKWHEAGKYVVQGFANGISKYSYIARNAAISMAQSALNAAKAVLRERSPSRAFYEVGAYAGEGFVNALDDYGSIAYNSAYGMADRAKTGLSNAISKISSMIDSDIDTQPTIRPVVDLSDVKSGVNALNNMIDTDASVGVMANVGAISNMMNNRIQNGTNNDVISAINKLRSELGKVGNTTYSVNGVTYDDGSATSDAVAALIRAIGLERRV